VNLELVNGYDCCGDDDPSEQSSQANQGENSSMSSIGDEEGEVPEQNASDIDDAA
jgi:hypothetical protein